jgi:AraC-like DNA-binding protein
VDVLSDVLKVVHVTGAIFFDVEGRPPWAAAMPAASGIAGSAMPQAEHVITVHAVLDGECWAKFENGSMRPVQLNAGDIMVAPMGDAHVLCSTPGLRTQPDLSFWQRPVDRPLPFVIGRGDGPGPRTRVVCGSIGCRAKPFNPILSALPRVLVCRAGNGLGHLTQLLQAAAAETATHRSGGETVLAKMAELIFVDLVRRHVEELPDHAMSWLAGLRDPHVGAALHLMHARPAEAWTVERLAQEVGQSRAVFAERFAHLVHDSPIQHLTRCRMQLAMQLLEQTGAQVAAVAREVGYESEAAFNRAFSKHVGLPPGAWRRGQRLPRT